MPHYMALLISVRLYADSGVYQYRAVFLIVAIVRIENCIRFLPDTFVLLTPSFKKHSELTTICELKINIFLTAGL